MEKICSFRQKLTNSYDVYYGKYFILPVIQTAERLGLGAKFSPPKVVVDSSQKKMKKIAHNSPIISPWA